MTQKIGAGLLEYAGKIWDTADTLRGAGIKESEWPTYMMPFFALMMLESRLRRFTHPDRKALLLPLLKRPELMMADYEEWVVSGGGSIVLNP